MTRTKSDQDKEKENVNLDIREESNAISNTKAIVSAYVNAPYNIQMHSNTENFLYHRHHHRCQHLNIFFFWKLSISLENQTL